MQMIDGRSEQKAAFCNKATCKPWSTRPKSTSTGKLIHKRSYPSFKSCIRNCPEPFFQFTNGSCSKCGDTVDTSACSSAESKYGSKFECKFRCEKKKYWECLETRGICFGFPKFMDPRPGMISYSNEGDCEASCPISRNKTQTETTTTTTTTTTATTAPTATTTTPRHIKSMVIDLRKMSREQFRGYLRQLPKSERDAARKQWRLARARWNWKRKDMAFDITRMTRRQFRKYLRQLRGGNAEKRGLNGDLDKIAPIGDHFLETEVAGHVL